MADEASLDRPRMVTGMFADRASVARAYRIAAGRGYDTADIDVLMSEDTRRRLFSGDQAVEGLVDNKGAEAGELGGPIGGTIGTLIPVIVAAGVLALPGLGLVAAGPVAAALAGAGAAGVAFSVIAALGNWGIPEERARQYDAGIRAGGILMTIRPRSDEDARYVEEQWKVCGGQHVHSYTSTPRRNGR